MFSNISIREPFLTLLLIAVFLCSSSVPLYAEDNDIAQGLLLGKGRDLVLENCTICHSTSIILQNHMTREAWDKTITWMQEEQGMWELESADRKSILDYLSSFQGADQNKHTDGKKRKNSMYEFYYPANPL